MRTKTYRLILASQSPRRRDILQDAGFDCHVLPTYSSEIFNKNLRLDENLCMISERKLDSCLGALSISKQKGIVILSADTVVVHKNKALGKPKNKAHARRMLSALSGQIHCVKTAFSLFCPDEGRGVTRIVSTKVGFRKLSKDEINAYVDSGEPLDKAGGYAIQGAASRFVNYLKGEYLNVVGLPIDTVIEELRREKWSLKCRRPPSRRRQKNS